MKAPLAVLFIVVFILGASVQPASAISITIDTTLTDADTLVFDIHWGNSPYLGINNKQFAYSDERFYNVVYADNYPNSLRLIDVSPRIYYHFDRPPYLYPFSIRYNENRLSEFAYSWNPPAGMSVSPLEGYPRGEGARITYDWGVPVPDHGPGLLSAFVTLGGLLGLASLRRLRST